jgi:hypothetical protein
LMLCELEDGGCGRFFAIFWTTSVLVKVAALVETDKTEDPCQTKPG